MAVVGAVVDACIDSMSRVAVTRGGALGGERARSGTETMGRLPSPSSHTAALDGGARVVLVCIEAGAEEHCVGVELAHRGQQHVLPNIPKLLGAAAWAERGAQYLIEGAVASRNGTGAWKERRLMARRIEPVGAVPHHCRVTIAMVHVKVQDGDALGAMHGLGVRDTYHHVVEEAEPPRLVWLRMVAGRPRHHKHPTHFSIAREHRVDCSHGEPGSAQRGRFCPWRGHGVRIQADGKTRLAHAAESGVEDRAVRVGMDARDLLFRDVDVKLPNTQLLTEVGKP
eukprot:scaffold30792_cov63-Phaeocystis_antarctica.AAC.11